MLKDFIIVASVILPLLLPMTHGKMDKRQVGVLARSGALPNGKRSLEALARNGELPGKRMELGTEEQLRLWRLSNWLAEVEAALKLQYEREHDLAKRNMEAMARSGYLVKPATEPPEPSSSLLDPEDFLGKVDSEWLDANEADGFDSAEGKRGGLASLARHGYIGKRNEASEEDNSDEKRSLGAAKNFLSLAGKRNIASMKNFISRNGKRSIGSFRNISPGKRHLGAARNFAAIKREELEDNEELGEIYKKRNLGAARRFTGKRNLGSAKNFLFNENKKNVGAVRNFYYGKRNIASFARDGGFYNLKHIDREDDYPWEENDEFDFDDFHDDEKRQLALIHSNPVDKRYLGSLRTGKRNLAAFKNFGKRLSNAEELRLASVLSDTTDDDVDDFLGKEFMDGASAIEKRETSDGGAGQGQGGTARGKRSVDYALSPELQDYDDYGDELYQNSLEKRFLGYEYPMAEILNIRKRHIGALARWGLLPSFRSPRYSRSGRAIDNRIIPFRENSSIRSCAAKDSATPWSAATPAETQLALRRSGVMAYLPPSSRTRHPMSYHRFTYA